jgi:hypothetical protein
MNGQMFDVVKVRSRGATQLEKSKTRMMKYSIYSTPLPYFEKRSFDNKETME